MTDADSVEYGVHLPLFTSAGAPRTLPEILAYARRAGALGFRFLCANDHLLYRRPWLDGPTVLAAAMEAAGDMQIATTVALPVIRGPAATAKLLTTLDVLSDGRLLAGVGPGSSPSDFAAAGIPFGERWPRFEEAVRALRALLTPGAPAFTGRFYTTRGVALEPVPVRPGGLPIWIASWGSDAGLRRVARLGDGWLASGFNASPDALRDRLGRLAHELASNGRDPTRFPHACATVWLYVTERSREADRLLADVLAPLLDRPVDELHRLQLPIGTPQVCAERISARLRAGARRIFLWPVADELRQIEAFRESVVPLVGLR